MQKVVFVNTTYVPKLQKRASVIECEKAFCGGYLHIKNAVVGEGGDKTKYFAGVCFGVLHPVAQRIKDSQRQGYMPLCES